MAVFGVVGNSGASSYGWDAPLAQTDFQLISKDTTMSSILFSTANVHSLFWIHFRIVGPGTATTPYLFNLMAQTGAVTGWTAVTSYLQIIAMPNSMITYLTHKDHGIRSLAWTRLRDGIDKKEQLKSEVREALKEYGIERKEKPGEDFVQKRIEERHQLLLQAPELKRQKALVREEKKRPLTPEDDPDQEWDEKEFLDKRYTFTGQKLRIMQDDEKSDRTKPADKRASSLKS
jgi:hypothetical protein